MAVNVDSLVFDLRASTAALEKDLAKANGKLAKQSTRMGKNAGTKMGAAFKGAFLRFVGPAVMAATGKQAIDLGSQISDLALGARVSSEEFQILSFAMREAGGEMNSVAQALSKVQKNVADAGSGLSTAKRALKNLNLSFEEMRTLDPVEMFKRIADGVVTAKDPLKAYGAAMDILGARNAPRLMEVLQRLGKEGWQQVADDARKAGAVMGDTTVQEMDAHADAIGNFLHRLKIFAGESIMALSNLPETKLRTHIALIAKLQNRARDMGNVSGFRAYSEQLRVLNEELKLLQETRASDPGQTGLTESELMALDEAADKMVELEGVAERLKDKLKTPYERAEEQLKAFSEAQAAGLITFQEQAAGHAMVVEELANATMEAAGPVQEAWENMSERMAGSLSEAFIEGGDALDDFLARSIRAMAAAQLEQHLLGPLLGSLFGAASPLGGFGKLLGFAGGGDPPTGQPYLVGEDGPELHMDRRPSTIIPNHDLAGIGGVQSVNVTQNIRFDVGLESVDQRIATAAPMIAQHTESIILDQQRRGRR